MFRQSRTFPSDVLSPDPPAPRAVGTFEGFVAAGVLIAHPFAHLDSCKSCLEGKFIQTFMLRIGIL